LLKKSLKIVEKSLKSLLKKARVVKRKSEKKKGF